MSRSFFAFVTATALFLLTSFFGSPGYGAAPPQPTLPDILVTDVEVKDTRDNIRDLFESAEPDHLETSRVTSHFVSRRPRSRQATNRVMTIRSDRRVSSRAGALKP